MADDEFSFTRTCTLRQFIRPRNEACLPAFIQLARDFTVVWRDGFLALHHHVNRPGAIMINAPQQHRYFEASQTYYHNVFKLVTDYDNNHRIDARYDDVRESVRIMDEELLSGPNGMAFIY